MDDAADIKNTPNKWVKAGALKMYNALLAQGKPIPPQLQEYIVNGLEREADGQIAYPVTRSGEYNPLKIYSLIRIQIEDHDANLNKAIRTVASELGISRRTVKDTYDKVVNDPIGFPDEFVYYLHSFLKDLK